MRKKCVALVLLCVTVVCFVGVMASGCAAKVDTPKAVRANCEDLAKGASLSAKSGSAGQTAVLKLDGQKTFNTIALKEKGKSVTSFEIYVNGEMVYASDYIDEFRYCALPKNYTADEISVKVVACEKEKWELRVPEVYKVERTLDDNFRVMSYILAHKALRLSEDDKKIIGATTQFNIFENVLMRYDGTLYFKEYTFDDGKYTGEEALRKAVSNLRQFNPNASIVVTVLDGDDTGTGFTAEQTYDSAMTKYTDTLVANCVKLIDDYGLDGIAFDYEYPHTLSTNNHYGKFLEKLKRAMPDGKELNCAFSMWNLKPAVYFPHSKLKYVDHIEFMTYDGFDERGDHSAFYAMCAQALAKLDSYGVDLSKVDLGLPFYSRPIDGATYWGDYAAFSKMLGKYNNRILQEVTPMDGDAYEQICYYNCWQTIYDKTAYAIDSKIGGVMIWHYGCDTTDSDLSLYGAIDDARSFRAK